ncbi:endonuclease-reverse transcriptase [Aphelenchoides avenae]|nr:endonuclease-reverse transcriptase [Aphelenchus avenae]
MADVQRRLNDLDKRSTAVGLRINRRKTEWLEYFDTQQELKLGSETIERTWKYVYLGQEIRWDHKLDSEITRRQKAAWNAYNNVKDALKNLTDARLRANLFNANVLPALLYGCETWAPTQNQE